MVCHKCGNNISDNAKFCEHCGAQLLGIDDAPPTIAKKIEPMEWSPPKRKSGILRKIVYVVIAFFFGYLLSFGFNGEEAFARVSKAELIVNAEIYVESYLKSPASAEFCSHREYLVEVDYEANLATVKGYVDSQNGFGAMLRTQFFIEFDTSNPKSLRVLYAELGDKSTGIYRNGNFKVLD